MIFNRVLKKKEIVVGGGGGVIIIVVVHTSPHPPHPQITRILPKMVTPHHIHSLIFYLIKPALAAVRLADHYTQCCNSDKIRNTASRNHDNLLRVSSKLA